MAITTSTSARRAAVLAAPLALAVALAVPASAAPGKATAKKLPVKQSTVTCVQPTSDLEFGGAQVTLKLKQNWLPKGEFFVLVPVNTATGLDAGPRTTVDRGQKIATAALPGDGMSLTPASTLEVRLGGEVVQRIAVRAGCGVLDPTPDAGPVIGAITSSAGTVTVPITNGSSITDEIGVTLFPVGGNTGESRFLVLAPGATGAVAFTGVPAGQYVVEAFGYTSFTQSESPPFTV